MARALATDPLHSMKFHVSEVGGFLDPEAGFNSVTTPEMTVEMAEYKEGIMTYTQKYPGNPSTSDITMSRGVTRIDTNFYDWIKAAIDGNEYRTDMEIRHYHRDAGTPIDPNNTKPAKKYVIYEAFTIRNKVAADLDATASDISLQEVDVAYESFDLEIVS